MSKKTSAAAQPTPLEAHKLSRLVLTTANYDFYRDNEAIVGEKGGGLSQTVPTPNLSLEEILIKFSQGMPIDGLLRPANYSENEYIPNFKAMDFTEIQQYREDLNNDITQRIQAMDAATREIAIRDGVLPEDINQQFPLPEPPVGGSTPKNQPPAGENQSPEGT